MPIQDSEIVFRKPAIVSDGSDNGGVMSTTEIVDNLKNNVWPDVPQAERAAGSIRYRKVFVHMASGENLAMQETRIFVEAPASGDDRVLIFPGTQVDTRAGITGLERLYGVGALDAAISPGATSLAVNCEAGSDLIFRDGDLVRVSNKANLDDPEGSEEYLRLAASGAVAWDGDLATLTLQNGTEVGNSYGAGSRVSSCMEAGTVQAASSNWGESSATGTYDETTCPVMVDAIGTVEQVWTATFVSSTSFDVTGDRLGSLGAGSTATDTAPANPAFGRPYFILAAAGWSGTWQAGDVVAFRTSPAAVAVWFKRIVPPDCGSVASDVPVLAVVGSSV